eukprot:6208856-Pleurochrysis_carterae.AAC.4
MNTEAHDGVVILSPRSPPANFFLLRSARPRLLLLRQVASNQSCRMIDKHKHELLSSLINLPAATASRNLLPQGPRGLPGGWTRCYPTAAADCARRGEAPL